MSSNTTTIISAALVALSATLLYGYASASSSSSCSSGMKRKDRFVPVGPSTLAAAQKTSDIKYPIEEIKAAKTDKEKFMVLYPMLRDEMLESMKKDNEMPEAAIEWARKMMDHTLPGGKLNRGVTVFTSYRAMIELGENGRPITDVETAQACVLGWTVEFLQAFFLVADDVMDGSKTRRGKECWFRLPNVNLIAINDAFILESFCYSILEKHFGHLDHLYPKLLSLTLDVVQKTEYGQLLDLTTAKEDEIDFTYYTMQRYSQIVKYKTAFYTFYLPIALGMVLADKPDMDFDLTRNICLQMGEYFQIQDDVLDCFGDPEVIGKVGTDIEENKCSWLCVQALAKCTPEQKKFMEENYGTFDKDKVAKIKALYREMKLEEQFKKFEESSYNSLQEELSKVKCMPREVFDALLNKIYKRSK